ncbi:hypothetical protein [Alteromonas facilis]|uniref:hypothetical protein n=1 Tax=Alteromonas facilis TaxID=2048004 RepID=UPI000C2860DF|nr:hypothetical protein [Alteromonas facilis]
MHSSKPDFTRYSQEELREALDYIDKEQFPERVAEIKSLIVASAPIASDDSAGPPKKKVWSPTTQFWCCLCFSLFMGALSYNAIVSGHIRLKRSDIYLEDSPTGFYISLLVYIVLLGFSLHGIYESRVRARKLETADDCLGTGNQ